MKQLALTVSKKESLNDFLRQTLPAELSQDVSNSKIRRLIISGMVSVNNRQCRIPSCMLYEGELVNVTLDEEKLFYEKQPDDISFEVTEKDVLFEDDSIIIVNKPAFFPTEAGMVASRDNLHVAVIRYLWNKNPSLRNPPYVGIMHRLDRETSGVILFTKTRTVNAACHDMFEKKTAKKVYRAVACPSDSVRAGAKLPSEGETFTVSFPMGRISAKSQAAKWGMLSESRGGVPSRTDFTVVAIKKEKGRQYFYLDCRLYTGRTHQIRVHLSSRSLPIAGDELYGGIRAKRIMLHASSLTFPHPVTGKVMTVTAPLPEEFSPNCL